VLSVDRHGLNAWIVLSVGNYTLTSSMRGYVLNHATAV